MTYRGRDVQGLTVRGERRRECRVPVWLDGTLKAGDERWAYSGIVEDLHRFGVRARVPELETLSENEPVVVDFPQVPSTQPVRGRVRWAKSCEEGGIRCGIALDDVLSMDLPLEWVSDACSRLLEQIRGTAVQTPPDARLLEKTLLTFHGETWMGGLLRVSSEPTQNVLNTLSATLELQGLRLRKALSETRISKSSPETPWTSLGQRAAELCDELQGASSKIKQYIHCLRLMHGALLLQPESYLYTLDPTQAIQQSVAAMETICAFLGGKLGVLRFKIENGALPLLAIRPVDFRQAMDACLLGLLESAMTTDASAVTVGCFVADGWIRITMGHDGFRLMQMDTMHIEPEDGRFLEKTSGRDERTALRFYHAILPLRDYGVRLHIFSESGRNRVHLQLPSVHVFPRQKASL